MEINLQSAMLLKMLLSTLLPSRKDDNFKYSIMRLNGQETDLSLSRKKIIGYERGLGRLSHGLGPFHAGDLHPAQAAVGRGQLPHAFLLHDPSAGARLIPQFPLQYDIAKCTLLHSSARSSNAQIA